MWNMNIWIHRITRRRPVPVVNDDGNDKSELGRSLSLLQLMLLGVGATIGTGIFFALAETVPKAGSGVIISFLLAGVVAGLTALCYAEIVSALFTLNLRRHGERAGRAAERIDHLERTHVIHRQMLDAASRRPRDRDDLLDRLRTGGF